MDVPVPTDLLSGCLVILGGSTVKKRRFDEKSVKEEQKIVDMGELQVCSLLFWQQVILLASYIIGYGSDLP